MPYILQLVNVARVAVTATLLVLTTQAGAVGIVGGTEADRERMAAISDEWLMLRDMGNLDPGWRDDGCLAADDMVVDQVLDEFLLTAPRLGLPG